MMKTKILCMLLLIMFVGVFMTGCNIDLIDTNLNLKYCIINMNGKRVLHKVSSWHTTESESVGIRTNCCNNYIWFSVNNGEFYEQIPNEEWYDYECK